MSKEKIRTAYNTLAGNYNARIEIKPHNAFYDVPNTLSLFPDVSGKRILDAGCGPGRYAELLLEKGAEITGMDLSPKMIEEARKRNKGRGNFFVHDISEPTPMLEDGSFDFVLSTLTLHYLQDWTTTFQEFYRVLKPGGLLIISIEHPFFEYQYFNSKKYFEVEHVTCTWRGFGFPIEMDSFRRSLMDCIAPFTENGFYIDKILEPRPVPEFEQHDPRHFKELNEFPAFLCIRAKKADQS